MKVTVVLKKNMLFLQYFTIFQYFDYRESRINQIASKVAI
jgi:hypothetical protein